MDEIADALGMDPLEFRYHNLKDARLRAVLEAAATRIGWENKPTAAGHGSDCGSTEKADMSPPPLRSL